jgi:hypothetical protein
MDKVTAPLAAPDQFVVHGQITYANGAGAKGMLVRAYDKDLRSEQLLGEASTALDGAYSISYSYSKFALAEAGTADLRISVCNADGREIASSPIRFNAKTDETINVVLPATVSGSSEYEGLLAAVTPLLQGVALQDLTGDDLIFLTGDLSVDLQKVLCLRESAKQAKPVMSATLEAQGQTFRGHSGLPAVVFYGWFRVGFPMQPGELWRRSASDLIEGLQSAIDQNIVPASLSSELEQIRKLIGAEQQQANPQPDQIAVLADFGSQTLADLAKQNPDQLQLLQTKLSAERRTVLLEQLKGASSALLTAVRTVDLGAIDTANQTLKQILLNALAGAKASPAAINEATWRLAGPEASGALADPARTDLPLEANPLFSQSVGQGRLAKLAGITGLAQTKLQTILSRGMTISGVREDVLLGLVKDKTLDADEANKIGVGVATYRLTNGQWDVVTAIGSAKITSIDSGLVKTPADLALLELQDWESVLKAANVQPPANSTLEDYSKDLTRRAALAFPVEALLGRLTRARVGLDTKLALLQPLVGKDKNALSKSVSNIKLQSLPSDQQAAAASALTEIRQLVNEHPGLGLANLFTSGKAPADLAKEATARLDALTKVYTQNPDTDFLSLDYKPGSAAVGGLDFTGVTAEQKPLVLEDLKAFQRVFRISSDAISAKAVLDGGYASGFSVAGDTLDSFKSATGLSDSQAVPIYNNAKIAAETAGGMAVSIVDWIRAGSLGKQFSTTDDDPSSYLRQLKGFTDWFGSQDYCNCQDCQSVLSPAAYFVDLMRFIETNISTVFSSQPSHPLYLKVRRSDLWTLQLTCDNTNNLVAYLDIINGILETYIGANVTLAVAGDVYSTLATTAKSIHQPFHLPLQRISLYLKHFQHSRRDIALAVGLGEPGLTKATLDISTKEYQLITTQDLNVGPPSPLATETLTNFFGDIAASVAAGQDVDVQKMLQCTGWNRADLTAFLATSFVNPSNAITIRSSKKDSNSIQNDIELIHGLDKPALDRLHRFSRLHSRLPWTIAETDLVLSCLTKASLGNGIGTTSLGNISLLLALNAMWSLAVDELCSYWKDIPQTSVDSGPSLFDQLFNQPPLLTAPSAVQAQPWPAPGEKFLHPALNTAPGGASSPGDNTNDRLLAGLKVNDQQLVDLILGLAVPLGLDAQKQFALSLDNLSLLYRHARLASLLNLTVPQLFQLAQFLSLGTPATTTTPAQYFVSSLSDLKKLQDEAAWINTSGYSLDEIGFVLNEPVLDPTSFQAPDQVAADILSRLSDSRAFEFADTVFTQISGTAGGTTRQLTDAESRDIVTANVGTALKKISEELPLYQLADGFDPLHGNITIPGGGPQINLTDVRTLLSQFHTRNLLPIQLGMSLKVTPAKATELLQLAGVDLGSSSLAQSMTQAAAPAALQSAVAGPIRYGVLYKESQFDPQVDLTTTPLTFIAAHRSVFYLPATGMPSDLKCVRRAAIYATLAAQNDPAFPAGAPDPDVNALHTAVDTGPMTCAADDLAKALRTDVARINGLRPNLASTPADPDRLLVLNQMRVALQLAADLGISAETLRLAVSDDSDATAGYKALQRAADGMYAAFRSKYPSDADFEDNVENFDNTLRVLKRDALTDFLLSVWPLRFPALNSLSEYFLVDVQLSGCARTSLVVAAISSLQFYVQRVLLNLEQTNDGTLIVTANDTVRAEWVWRKNFRVWQANRKVFLFPENYLDPDLRGDKTPLFETLQDTLLQRQIDDQNVQDAYAAYMASLMEIGNLNIAGAFHDFNANGDVVHLFGATASDPPTYYYRAVSNLFFSEFPPYPVSPLPVDWSCWQKIDVQIPVRKVAPIVFNGTLYVFWTEIITQSQNQFKDGSSQFSGYHHKISLKFSNLRLDGSWTAPQAVGLGNNALVDDPLCDPMEIVNAFTSLPGTTNISVSSGLIGAVITDLEVLDPKKVASDLNVSSLEDITDPKVRAAFLACFSPRYDPSTPHYQPQDNYTLTGYQWDEVYPDEVSHDGNAIVWMKAFTPLLIDLWKKSATPLWPSTNPQPTPNGLFFDGSQLLNFDFSSDNVGATGYASRSQYLSNQRMKAWGQSDTAIATYQTYHSPVRVAQLAAGAKLDIAAVNSNLVVADAIVNINGDELYYLGDIAFNASYVLYRLGTTVAPALSKALFLGGIDGLLSFDFQSSPEVQEAALPLTIWGLTKDESNSGALALSGPFGVYFREIFFHIPFLIAQHLNTQQQYAAAQRWYEYIFNPTAIDQQVWRYIEFRLPQKGQTMMDQLSDPDAIGVYQKDPFDPFAIAEQRTSAFQKAVVLKYIDNLLDWGDSLFMEFTMESVNEATLLYLYAQDILGPRPADIGDCGEDQTGSRDYAHVVAGGASDDFLVELETVVISRNPGNLPPRGEFAQIEMGTDPVHTLIKNGSTSSVAAAPAPPAAARAAAATATAAAAKSSTPSTSSAVGSVAKPYSWNDVGPAVWTQKGSTPWPPDAKANGTSASGGIGGLVLSADPAMTALVPPHAPNYTLDEIGIKKYGVVAPRTNGRTSSAQKSHGGLGYTVVQQSLMFCIPNNPELLARWDRVEDRLNKIRNCKTITGESAQLALFAPPIDPHLLQQISAAGLTLGDVLNVTSGNLPPYRFTVVIEKARQFAGTLQSFGSQLLSALETRDSEQLNQLRTVHEQNLLTMKKTGQQWEVNSAEDTLTSLQRQQVVVQGRLDYYNALLQNGPIPSETSQMMNLTVSTELGIAGAVLRILGGISYLIPQLGAPTAMKWGGKEMGDSLTSFAQLLSEFGSIHQMLSSASAQSAVFERRSQEWVQQAQQAQKEFDQLDKQVSAATFRKQIADNALDVHNKSIEQANEIFQFYQDRFTNAGLYALLSTMLQTLYRGAFQSALSMAKLAEQAYLFERPEDSDPPLLTESPWDLSTGGLLAGETLQLYLQRLEQRFLETNFRKLEIEHSFSVFQFAPDALEQLRENGTCSWSVPEWFFDLYYPGQYNRRLKAVRITIPCVTGPFTNIGATLELTGSRIRHDPTTRSAANLTGLVSQPLRHTVSIATSKGQSDSGVFEFSFRDERYMPFEGAGAVSDWQLSLPKVLRAFDYNTISDVIIHLNYTADFDGALRDQIETESQGLVPLLNKSFKPLKRIFSLRKDMPNVYYRLISSLVNTEVPFTIEPRHLPFFLGARPLGVSAAKLHVVSSLSTLNGFALGVGQKATTAGTTTNYRAVQAPAGNASGALGKQDFDLGDVLQAGTNGGIAPSLYGDYLIKVTVSGPLAYQNPSVGAGAIDPQNLSDILLEINYGLN